MKVVVIIKIGFSRVFETCKTAMKVVVTIKIGLSCVFVLIFLVALRYVNMA